MINIFMVSPYYNNRLCVMKVSSEYLWSNFNFIAVPQEYQDLNSWNYIFDFVIYFMLYYTCDRYGTCVFF